jgi:hypothetical protein
MQTVKSIFTSWTGWGAIVTTIVTLNTALAPVIPAPWEAVIAAVIGLFTFYKIGTTVTIAKGGVGNVKGV